MLNAFVIVAICCIQANLPSRLADIQLTEIGDMICGPRCVQQVLAYYNIESDLIDLVKECQWPEFEKGSSLNELSSALEKRGVYTLALKVGKTAQLTSEYPAIIHLTSESSLGHFVILMPGSTTEQVRIWSGISGIEVGGYATLAPKMSGSILLTSPVPIEDPSHSFTTSHSLTTLLDLAVTLTLSLVLTVLFCRVLLKYALHRGLLHSRIN